MKPSPNSFGIPILLLLFASVCWAQDIPLEAPAGVGQLDQAPKIIPGGVDETGRSFSYNGQRAQGGKLVLTASNGFFTKGTCRAAGESDLPKVGDEKLIVPNFARLEKWTSTEGTLRWHFHIARPRKVRFQTFLEVPGGSSGSTVEFQFAGQTQQVAAGASDGKSPQAWDVVFDVAEAGEYCLALQAVKISDESFGVGNLTRIEAFGPAIEEAHLLRVRWRPAAAHGGYESAGAGGSKLLVMTTRSTVPISSYSPITTPFGYFGTSFTAEKRSNGEFNFSMWGQEGAASDLKQMPHLLGIGSPEGEFSGFGHEGSGVKARGWTPMPDQPELCVQALRVESGELYDAYFGYYFDHPTNAWKFYCAGNKWHGGKPKTELKVGSFCEVPGPPQVERTGDVYREVRRRGWYFTEDGKWTAMETFKPGGAGSKPGEPVNKRWYTSEEGEFAMGCGGIRLYEAIPPESPGAVAELPYFLKSDSTANLFRLPVEYGEVRVADVAGDSATIEFEIGKGSQPGSAAVYFGTVDALTFAPRELHGTEKNSALSKSVNDRVWQQVQPVEEVVEGVNRIVIAKLEPGTPYFFRVLTTNAVSRVWNDRTVSFSTTEEGAVSMKAAPGLDTEPIRTWVYQANGKERRIEGRLTGIAGDQIEIERKADGKTGKLKLSIFSQADQEYVAGKR